MDEFKPAQRYLFRHDSDLKKRTRENTLNAALRRMGYQERLTGHGIRGTMSTALNEIGYPKVWVDSQLSHVDPNKVSATYNHAEYVEQRRRMMQDWADRLDLLEQNHVEEASKHLTVSIHGVPAVGVAGCGARPSPATDITSEDGPQTPQLQASAQRLSAVTRPWLELQPGLSDAQREQLEKLAIYESPHSLTAAAYARAVGVS